MQTIPKAFSLILTALLIGAPVAAGAADTDADIARQQAPLLRGTGQTIATDAGYAAGDIEVTSTVHQVTVTVVNSKLNAQGAAARESEGARIAATLGGSIAGVASFSQVMVLHIDYVERSSGRSDAVDRLDYYKGPGGFLPHKT